MKPQNLKVTLKFWPPCKCARANAATLWGWVRKGSVHKQSRVTARAGAEIALDQVGNRNLAIRAMQVCGSVQVLVFYDISHEWKSAHVTHVRTDHT